MVSKKMQKVVRKYLNSKYIKLNEQERKKLINKIVLTEIMKRIINDEDISELLYFL